MSHCVTLLNTQFSILILSPNIDCMELSQIAQLFLIFCGCSEIRYQSEQGRKEHSFENYSLSITLAGYKYQQYTMYT